MHRRQHGFTVLDLVVAMGIAALLLAAGVPALRSLLTAQRLQAATASLQSGLLYARSEAIHLGVPALACPGLAAAGCAGDAPWDQGWIVFTDGDGNGELDPGDTLLRAGPPLAEVSATSSLARRRLRFLPDGSAPGSNATVLICSADGSGTPWQIRISNSGRIRSLKVADPGTVNC